MKKPALSTLGRRAFAGFGVAGLLSACAPIDILNDVSTGSRKYDAREGIPYGALPRQQLDMYVPRTVRPEAGWPMVVFFYGGSWSSGERSDYAFVGAALASRGVLTLVADYRLYPQVRYPEFLEDTALALAYGIDHAQVLGADPKRIFVMGHSAGGYNAAMMALDERWMAATGHAPRELAGWLGLSGPYDFFPSTDPALRDIFHHPNYPAGGQPIDHADHVAPRTFLGAPPDDKLVSFQRSTQQLARRLEAAGTSVTLKTYPRASHQTLIGSFAWPLRWAGPVLSDVVDFVGVA